MRPRRPTSRFATALAVVGAGLLTAAPAATAAPPPNDAFASPQGVGPGLPVAAGGTTVDATAEPGEPSHGLSPAAQSVWFTWTPADAVPVGINVCESAHPVRVSVYTGSPVGSLTRVNLTQVGQPCMQRFPASAGTTYRIAVDRVDSPGAFQMHMRDLSGPPPNDDFDDAQALPAELPAGVAGDMVNATEEPGEPDHDEGGHIDSDSVWYRWTAQSNGSVKVDACGSPAARYAVYTGDSVDQLQSVAPYEFFVCSRTFDVVAGTTYSIAVDDDIGDLGFSLTLRPASRPPNDDFEDAIELPEFTPVELEDDNIDATAEANEPAHWPYHPARKSVWYSWTAPIDSEVLIFCEGDVPPRLGVYTGSDLATLQPVAPPTGRGDCSIDFEAEEGVTYRIAVDSKDGDGDEGAFSLMLDGPYEPPANDDFANAQAIGPALPLSVEGDNLGSTAETFEPYVHGVPALFSVWYSWTAPTTGPVIIDTCRSDFDSLLAVYKGPGMGHDFVGSSDDGATCAAGGENDLGSAVQLNASAGTTYKIVVDGYEEGLFDLRVRATAPHGAVTPATPTAPKCRKGTKPKKGKCVKKKKRKKKAKKRR